MTEWIDCGIIPKKDSFLMKGWNAICNLASESIEAIGQRLESKRGYNKRQQRREYRCRRRGWVLKGGTAYLAMYSVAMNASISAAERCSPFDTDSCPIGVDNRCSACISHDINDFEGPLVDTD